MEYYTCDNSNSIAYNGNISAKDLLKDELKTSLTGIGITEDGKISGNISAPYPYTSNLIVDSAWFNRDCDITLNEKFLQKLANEVKNELAAIKMNPDDGPEIPKWTGFLPI